MYSIPCSIVCFTALTGVTFFFYSCKARPFTSKRITTLFISLFALLWSFGRELQGLPIFPPPGLAYHRAVLLRETLLHVSVILTSWGVAFVYFLLPKAYMFYSSDFPTSAKSVVPAPDSPYVQAPSWLTLLIEFILVACFPFGRSIQI